MSVEKSVSGEKVENSEKLEGGENIDDDSTNFLTILLEKFHEQNSNRVSRLVLVGELTSQQTQPFVAMHNSFNTQHNSDLSGVMFIVNANTFLEVVEAPSALLVEFIEAVAKSEVACRILTSVEEVQRIFPPWEMRMKRVPTGEQAVIESSDLAVDVFELVKPLLRLGMAVQRVSSGKRSDFLDSKKREVIAAIPSAEVLRRFAACGRFFTPQQYMDLFYGPVTIELDSDLVWPMESFLHRGTASRDILRCE